MYENLKNHNMLILLVKVTLVDIERISGSGVTFFMTYVLPMAMDDLDTWKGIFCICIFNDNAVCINVENKSVLPKSGVNCVGI